MLKPIDDFLNKITMYRLVLYVLIFFLVTSFILSFFDLLLFKPFELLFSTLIITAVCWITNKIFSQLFKVPANLESVYITALILSLVITPTTNFNNLLFLAFVSILSQASKYILAVKRKHIFNPAALSIVVSALVIGKAASWWIGTPVMTPIILLGGLLVIRKIQRFSLVLGFLIISLSLLFASGVYSTILETPLLFFAFIMLTEPQTTPPKKWMQIVYGGTVGFLTYYLSFENALILGNIFSYIVSPKGKFLLKLQEKKIIGPQTYDFVFKFKERIKYLPGQYMEWTLGHKNPDSRGVRRYFTLASSPLEDNLRIGIKFYEKPSSFKRKLMEMVKEDPIILSGPFGEFTLPKNKNEKLVFIAGGIGITPFRSMIKYLLDGNEKRDIILLYSTKVEEEVVYEDIFQKAQTEFGIKTIYVATDKMGFIDDKMIKKEVPDYKERTFYISGPHSMVDVFEKALKMMSVSSSKIKVDFFPGYV